jgi:hypothetical protein
LTVLRRSYKQKEGSVQRLTARAWIDREFLRNNTDHFGFHILHRPKLQPSLSWFKPSSLERAIVPDGRCAGHVQIRARGITCCRMLLAQAQRRSMAPNSVVHEASAFPVPSIGLKLMGDRGHAEGQPTAFTMVQKNRR